MGRINFNLPATCIICGEKTHTVYARWVAGILCSTKCNDEQIKRYKEKLREKVIQSGGTSARSKGDGSVG